jgi:hypothetical protein
MRGVSTYVAAYIAYSRGKRALRVSKTKNDGVVGTGDFVRGSLT